MLSGAARAGVDPALLEGISNEIATWAHVDVLLIDRPIPDALGYYLAALDHRGEAPDPDALAHLRCLAVRHSVHYDLLYRTTLDQHIPLGTDKPRDRDQRFRALADIYVGRVLTDLGIGHRLLPADRHTTAIDEATRFALHRLAGSAPSVAALEPAHVGTATDRITDGRAAQQQAARQPALAELHQPIAANETLHRLTTRRPD
jgi:hypothetical protein